MQSENYVAKKQDSRFTKLKFISEENRNRLRMHNFHRDKI